LDVIATIFFFSATIILIAISIIYRKEEAVRVENELKLLLEYKAKLEADRAKHEEEMRNRA
jgi:cell division protein FtsL